MQLKSAGAFSLTGAIVAAAAGSIWAAVPLNQVLDWQKTAPEALKVTALSVDQSSANHSSEHSGSVTTINVTLTAMVDVVHRTTSGLVPGSVIVVRYSRSLRIPPVPGIQQDIVLTIGEKAAVYLKQTNDKTYELACPLDAWKDYEHFYFSQPPGCTMAAVAQYGDDFDLNQSALSHTVCI
jgi:hypothetical protein